MLNSGKLLALVIGILACSTALAQQVDLRKLPDYPPQPVTEANWMITPDNMRWISRHFSVKPSLVLARGGAVFQLPREPVNTAVIEGRSFRHPDSGAQLSLLEALELAHTDAYLVLKNGKLIYERYFAGMQAHHHHSWYSGAKSLLGMAVGLLVEEGLIDVNKSPSFYLPELKGSAFSKVTIRNVLNMTSALAYTEDSAAMEEGHLRHAYLQRAGMLPPYDVYMQTLDPGTATIPRGVRGLMPLIEASRERRPGEAFSYQNINVDVMGWLIERVSAQPLDEFLRNRVWAPLQTEHDALMPVDPNFTALASGGLSSTARDAARFGLVVLNGGQLPNESVFPHAWIRDSCEYTEADARAFARREPVKSDFSSFGTIKAYRNYWYVIDRESCTMATRGFGGQSIYVNMAAAVVIVTFASSVPENRSWNNLVTYFSHRLALQL